MHRRVVGLAPSSKTRGLEAIEPNRRRCPRPPALSYALNQKASEAPEAGGEMLRC